MHYPRRIKDVVRLLREDTQTYLAFLHERIATHGSVDVTFLRHYLECVVERLKWIEDLL